MATSDPTLERVEHAINPNGDIELVRYDRAGKWYLEWKDGRRVRVPVRQAARIALAWEQAGGTIFPRQYGGSAFIREVEKLRFKS